MQDFQWVRRIHDLGANKFFQLLGQPAPPSNENPQTRKQNLQKFWACRDM